MKAAFPTLARAALLCALTLPASLSTAQAAPRCAEHSGFSRVVFDVPARVQAKATQGAGGLYTVTLSRPLSRGQQGALQTRGARFYYMAGTHISLQLNGASKPHFQQLSGPQGTRLVVDIPNPASPPISSPPTSKQATSSPHITSASTASRAIPTVVIDAGHGGVDPGMQSPWVREKDVTLDIALKVRQRLKARGIHVIMTRDHDTQLSVDKTTDLEMRSRLARNDKVGAYVSIHVNAGGPYAQGIETYYFGAPLSGSKRSLAVAENGGGNVGQRLTARAANTAQNLMGDLVTQAKLSFSRSLASRVQGGLIHATGAFNRGVLSDAFYVIRNPTTAAILVEVGFGSSASEGPKLAQGGYRQKLADSIADSIADFLHH